MNEIDWTKPHILKIGNEANCFDELELKEKTKRSRQKVEPWLTAVFQSEHLSLLAGTGLTTAISILAGISSKGMERIEFDGEFKELIKNNAESQANSMARGKANAEDDLRIALELYKGLLIQNKQKAKELKTEIDKNLLAFIKQVLKTENEFLQTRNCDYQKNCSENCKNALSYLKSFLVSFASRTASRDRLNIITTNYDRFIEYACDMAGIMILDSFTGKITPVFRTNKIALDFHYNPPGIRGEPRYVEGVIRYTKLHGSLDWKFDKNQIIKTLLPFGANEKHTALPNNNSTSNYSVIYPNSAKNIETVYFPYAELFRDFSTAICQPNSVTVTYGYGFGDSHINRILEDMLTIPSTHIVIISWDDADGRIQKFVENNNPSQFTLLIGNHFGNLKTLVDNYLPKAAIDKITERQQRLFEKRGKEEFPERENNPDKNGRDV